jgi:hypothetical protein
MTLRNNFFASKHYFNGDTLSRRDDIIQICYNLLYFMNTRDFDMADIFLQRDDNFDSMKKYK